MNIEIANRLVQLRKKNAMSQEELAEKIGISRQAISKWERAEASPDTGNLILLARLYGVSLDELLRTDDDDQSLREDAAASQKAEASFPEPPPVSPWSPDITPETSTPWWEPCQKRRTPKWIIFLSGLFLFIACCVLKFFFASVADIYPLVCSLYFLIIGCCFNMWHPGWLIYLTIPLFYTLF